MKAILRIQKLKSFGAITRSGRHTDRKQETPNANAAIENIDLMPDPKGRLIQQLVAETIGDIKYRKDAILCAEFLLTASPAYFRPDAPEQGGYFQQEQLDPWVDANIRWLQKKYGKNLAKAELHLDEQTPHIVAYIVPIHDDPRKPGQKKLSYKVDFGGSIKQLVALQDEYAQAMAHLGLERGVRGSKATHQATQTYYTEVNASAEAKARLEAERQAEQQQLDEQRRQVAAARQQLEVERRQAEAAQRRQMQEERRQIAAEKRQFWAEQIATEAAALWIQNGKDIETEDGYRVRFDRKTKTLTVASTETKVVLLQKQDMTVIVTEQLQQTHFDHWVHRRMQQLAKQNKQQAAAIDRYTSTNQSSLAIG